MPISLSSTRIPNIRVTRPPQRIFLLVLKQPCVLQEIAINNRTRTVTHPVPRFDIAIDRPATTTILTMNNKANAKIKTRELAVENWPRSLLKRLTKENVHDHRIQFRQNWNTGRMSCPGAWPELRVSDAISVSCNSLMLLVSSRSFSLVASSSRF